MRGGLGRGSAMRQSWPPWAAAGATVVPFGDLGHRWRARRPASCRAPTRATHGRSERPIGTEHRCERAHSLAQGRHGRQMTEPAPEAGARRPSAGAGGVVRPPRPRGPRDPAMRQPRRPSAAAGATVVPFADRGHRRRARRPTSCHAPTRATHGRSARPIGAERRPEPAGSLAQGRHGRQMTEPRRRSRCYGAVGRSRRVWRAAATTDAWDQGIGTPSPRRHSAKRSS